MRVFIERAKKTDFAFWSGVKDITDVKTPPPAVSLEDMVKELHDCINIPADIPANFDLDSLLRAAMECDMIPPTTMGTTPDGFFLCHFTLDQLTEAKERLQIVIDSCTGFDTATYARFLVIDNDELLCLYNRCLDLQGAPWLWLISVLIGVLKPGKDASVPGNYRLIGLESCFL